jgi:flagellar basal body-associated protein FliL
MAEVEERQGDLIEDGLDDVASGPKKKGPNLVLIISISLLVIATGIAAYFIFKPKKGFMEIRCNSDRYEECKTNFVHRIGLENFVIMLHNKYFELLTIKNK